MQVRDLAPQPLYLYFLTYLVRAVPRVVSLVAQTSLDPSRVSLLAGDATSTLSALAPGSIDVVLALDCAYHFNTRHTFLLSAHRLLAPGGRIALTDLVLPTRRLGALESLAIRAMYILAGLPLANLITAKASVRRIEEMGYEDVRCEVVSERVWPGFCRFVERCDRELGGVLHPGHWGGLVRYARVVRWYADLGGGGRGRRLEFVIVTARKKREQ